MNDLEQQLLNDKSFQHILKFAPKSQRELMTFELARYFEPHLKKATVEAKHEQIMQDFLSLNVKFDGCVDERDLIDWRDTQLNVESER